MVQVLIVDDERSIRVTLSEFLNKGDYEVSVASDADQALEMLAAKNYDVVVTDIIMPRMTGVKLLQSIKESAPRVQVIMMTGEPTIETASEAVRTGAFDYLTKPISREDLVKAVANAAKIKSLDDERLRLEDENRQYQEHLEELVNERTLALRESEKQFRRAVVDSPVPIMIHDEDDNILQLSIGWTDYSGYTIKDIPTMSVWTEKAYGSSTGTEKKYIDELFEINKTVDNGEWIIIAKNGSKRIWDFKTTPIGKNARGKRLLQSIAVDVTERKQAEVALQRYAKELETLNTITATLSTSLELDKVLELILAQIGHVIPFDSGAIFLYEEDGLRVVADIGITPSHRGHIFPLGDKLFQKIQKTQKPLIVNDLERDTRFQNWGKAENLGSWMGVPLFVRDTLIGILTLDSAQPDAYSLELTTLVLSFASQAAQAIENARLFQEATQRLERMDSLRKIDQAITSNLDLKVILNILLNQLQEKLAVDAVAVLLYKNSVQTLSFVQGQGFQTDWIRQTNVLLGQGFAGKVALDRRDIFIQDLEQSEIHALRPEKIKEEGFLSYYGLPLIAKGQLVGVLEIFHRSLLTPSSEWISFLQTLAGQAAIAIDNITLYRDLQISNTNLSLAYDATIEGWAQALEMRDMETEGHSRRVVETTVELARTLGYSDENLAHLRRGALLHDIGKMGVPDAILQKPGQLTEDEWQVMREHPVYAYKWLSSIDYLKPALDIPYCHHEKWDGTGYPRGLAGEKIPLGARIFAIVDVWDALLSDRPYRKAWSREKAILHIQEQSSIHFDPQVVDTFLKFVDKGINS